MVQKEVAERMAAKPVDMSLLGLSVQFYGVPRLIEQVPAEAFFPPPRVDSAIIRVDLFPEPPLDPTLRDRFFRLAHAGFAEKRKQLHNSLARNLHLPQETVGRWLAAAEIDPMRRAETLRLEEWLLLTHIVQE
jgi:16S rRNA (adenine1518-N6/adenine1519-N6)-dimethyltransferase